MASTPPRSELNLVRYSKLVVLAVALALALGHGHNREDLFLAVNPMKLRSLYPFGPNRLYPDEPRLALNSNQFGGCRQASSI